MLNIINSVNWDIYKKDAPRLDIRAALVKLNSNQEAERSQGFYDVTQGIEFSMRQQNRLIFDLVITLFQLMQLTDFKYKELASELLLICGQFAAAGGITPELINQQNQLMKLLCKQLREYMGKELTELDADSRDNLAYLAANCRTQ